MLTENHPAEAADDGTTRTALADADGGGITGDSNEKKKMTDDDDDAKAKEEVENEKKEESEEWWEATINVDDPNYRGDEYDYDLMKIVQKAYDDLPDGWIKNVDKLEGGGNNNNKAPFIHVPTGKLSWKHPNRQAILKLVAEAQQKAAEKKPSYGRAYNPQDAMISRLKKMVKSGVPLAAVEQRARIEGIEDMSLLIDSDTDSEHSSEHSSSGSSRCRPSTWKSTTTTKKKKINRKDPFKKYRLMLKNGIPMGAVYQTAERDGIVLPTNNDDDDDFKMPSSSSSEDAGTTAAAKVSSSSKTSPAASSKKKAPVPNLKKYRTMLKNRIPLEAVKRHMKIDGLDPSLLLDDDEGKSNKDSGAINAAATTSATSTGSEVGGGDNNVVKTVLLFHPSPNDSNNNKQVEFMTFKDGTSNALLSKLVRRMVQTVSKRPGSRGIGFGGNNNNNNLVVDTQTLFNGLGGFIGVQNQLRQFNKTFEDNEDDDDENENVRRLLRKPFLELARNLGIATESLSQNGMTIPGLDDLITYIQDCYKSELQAIQSNLDSGMYDFDSLGQIYKPGTKVVAKNVVAGGIDMICQVEWNRYEQGRTLFGISKYFKVCVTFMVAVGNHFTLVEVVHGIESFDTGRRRLKDLQFVPLSAYPKEEIHDMITEFQNRGKIYNKVAVRDANYLAYSKGSFFSKTGNNRNTAAAFATGGRIIVDTQGAYDYGHTLGVGYDPMIMSIKYKYKEYMLHMRSVQQKEQSGSSSSSSGGGGGSHDNSDLMLFDHVPKDYLAMAWPAVVGFSLTSKTWGDVLVDGLSEIDFQETAFDSLVLPASRKRMVKALVRHSDESFNDVISGKGEGSVFLLYGPPGVGKTLTAEAISELLHRPLYSVSLGQLGLTPSDLETKLGEILELCGKWNALILLDEADIFLEKRSATTGSLERNAMVSVMLRLVEYFKGVLFLTSNRIDSLDPAFKTRITLALRYDQLDIEARKQVWTNLLVASGQNLTKFDIDELAKHVLNGREIKNAIRLAMALAAEEEEETGTSSPLSQHYILETVDILNDFNKKMDSAEAY